MRADPEKGITSAGDARPEAVNYAADSAGFSAPPPARGPIRRVPVRIPQGTVDAYGLRMPNPAYPWDESDDARLAAAERRLMHDWGTVREVRGGQFSVGRSMRSITNTGTIARDRSSRNPSCSWSAVKKSGAASAGADGSAAALSGRGEKVSSTAQ